MTYLSFAKQVVKKTTVGNKIISLLPKRVLYGRTYYDVVRLYQWEKMERYNDIDLFLRNRMAKTLRNALINVPWYKKNVDIDPMSINEENVYDKLLLFPYTDKQIVMQNWNDFININIPSYKLRYGSTEGTTGQGVKIARNHSDTSCTIAFLEQNLSGVNYDYLKSKVFRIGLDGLKKENEYPIAIRGNRCYVSPIHMTDKWLKTIYDQAVKYKPDVIHTYPSLLYVLASYIVEQGLAPIKTKCLLLASDTLFYHYYNTFEKAFLFNKFYCIYGMSECVLQAHAVIDKTNKSIGYKLHPFYGVGENYINEDGNCELVGTSYWMETMPFIRYKTNDFGKINESGLIEHLEGRKSTFLTTKKGDKISGISVLDFENYFWDYVKIIQLVQFAPGKITLRVVPKNNYTEEIGKRFLNDMNRTWPGIFDFNIETAPAPIKGRSLKANSIIVNPT